MIIRGKQLFLLFIQTGEKASTFSVPTSTDRLKAIIKTAKGKDVATAHRLWPIPIQEINNNSDIDPDDQNPGY